MQLFLAAGSSSPDYWPFAVLAISVALIIVLITVLRVHAFLALILAAFAAGLLAHQLPGEPEKNHWVQAVELTTAEFGLTAGKIGVVIALASVISVCLMESGAADKVVRRFLAVFGEKHAGTAIFLSGYVISIPIFFDTFFMLLLPLARAMAFRTGKNYVAYVMAICCGGVVTHSLCAPHPGPLAMAEALQIDLGLSIIIGILVGIGPASVTWVVANWINRHVQIPLREVAGAPLADLKKIVEKPEKELPSFLWSITPILLPIALISLASFCDAVVKKPQTFSGIVALFGGPESFKILAQWMAFIGNRNVALLIGTLIAIWVLMRQRGITVAQVCEMVGPPFETAGVIILITSAGGAFGLMLKNAGVGEAIRTSVDWGNIHPLLLVPACWAIASVIRIAQGSATVAMLTTSAMVYPIMSTVPLPYHPIYIFIAIGFGAMILSWMNDSGFWVVGRLSGFTEKETLKTWTVVATVNSIVGLLECMILSWVLPLKWLT